MRNAIGISRAFATAIAMVVASTAFAADDGTWSVKKSSGDVWMGSTSGVQQASVKTDEVLKPGDTIRTGRNGRVLLARGEESILIAPNTVVALPQEKKEGLSTTIKQQAGSILLEVEKKNVRHFEVETPYLAAVVKGTQFRVTVNASGATVDVVRGQVEVADFKTGQIAQIMPGQHATAFSHGNAGLSLGGAGTLQPIQHGQPRASTIDRVPVPRNGLSAPNKPGSASLQPHRHGAGAPKPGVTRISSSLGEVKVNVHRVTHGLARNSGAAPGMRSAANRDTATVWGSGDSGSNGSTGQSSGNGNGGGAAGAAASSVSSTVAAVVGSGTGGGNGNGNGNGNNGNGNGNNGNNGNHGNGNNGNGNGRKK
ncbi:FecR family protein [Bradyrhizobium sp.]|uniref:FecR family protein n=1 Tax=Bradyrhizobium sp. TaxID=376 RepID=UPI001D6891FA|nr:FecR family protein [Bradyrhizobium sp.]MBI5318796.1 FecR domain-containing protein [Bradyrhizobium sp.]